MYFDVKLLVAVGPHSGRLMLPVHTLVRQLQVVTAEVCMRLRDVLRKPIITAVERFFRDAAEALRVARP